jgi:hypothetical protein
MCKHFETKALQTAIIQDIAKKVSIASNMKTNSVNVKKTALFESLTSAGQYDDFMHIGNCDQCFRKMTGIFSDTIKLNSYHRMVRNAMRRENEKDLVVA